MTMIVLGSGSKCNGCHGMYYLECPQWSTSICPTWPACGWRRVAWHVRAMTAARCCGDRTTVESSPSSTNWTRGRRSQEANMSGTAPDSPCV